MPTARLDFYAKAILTVIALLLAVIAFRPIAVHAQADRPSYYIEPGISTLTASDGGSLGQGKVVVDLRNGSVWGFPTNVDTVYPNDPISLKPVVSKPTYLGKFDFSAMHTN